METKWIKRWEVPKSSGDGVWVVAIDKNDNYGCSCPVWKFKREECHHILEIKQNGGQEIKELSEEERGNLKLKAYEEKGYRCYTFFQNPLNRWDIETIESLKRNDTITDVKTFKVNRQRFVLIKENEKAYEKEYTQFIELLKRCNWRRKLVKSPFCQGNSWEPGHWLTQSELKTELHKHWFNIVQHIIYNNTGIVNRNLPEGSVYNSGEWGKRMGRLRKHFRFLR